MAMISTYLPVPECRLPLWASRCFNLELKMSSKLYGLAECLLCSWILCVLEAELHRCPAMQGARMGSIWSIFTLEVLQELSPFAAGRGR